MRNRGFFEGTPDLAIEVLSPSNGPGEILQKVAKFLEAGTAVVWVVDPRSRSVVIHRQAMVPEIAGEADRLDAEEILPGFSLDVTYIFEY